MNAEDFALYLVSDRNQTAARPLAAVVDAACRGGVRAVQLRERDLDTRSLLDLAGELRDVTRAHAARLLINDRVDVALACDADGVHLPAHSFAIAEARQLLGTARLIGASTHSPAEAAAAARAGADFVVCGPVFDTPSKRPFGPPLGLAALRRAREICTAPLLAIGGIDPGNVAAVRACGVAGVAVIRAVLAADDPERAARDLLNPPPGE